MHVEGRQETQSSSNFGWTVTFRFYNKILMQVQVPGDRHGLRRQMRLRRKEQPVFWPSELFWGLPQLLV